MSWFMRICVGDLTGSSEVIFQILGRKKERKKVNIEITSIKKKYIIYRGRDKFKKKDRVVNETKK